MGSLTIGQMARPAGVGIDPVRFYERQGLLAAEIHEVLVADDGMAKQLRFYGSPTIRIDGRDIEGESEGAPTFALSCRLYRGSRQVGVPPSGMIHRAIREARQGEGP